jgi:long-chain acyl-CoA synthetase
MPPEDAPAILMTTSGTTGRPKFVTHTPATLSATVEALADQDFDAAQIVLNACPMVHASGLLTFLLSVNWGAPMIMVERFDPESALDRIEQHGCTWMPGLPFMYDAMLEHQRKRPRNVTSLRHCLCGEDVCPIQLQVEFEATFGAPLCNLWAATEVAGALAVGSRPGPIVRIAPGAQVRLVDDEGRDVPRGEVGEFLVRGPNVSGAGDAALGGILKDTRRQLADYKAPERLWAVDAVPRNPLGKVDRRAAAATAMLGRAA